MAFLANPTSSSEVSIQLHSFVVFLINSPYPSKIKVLYCDLSAFLINWLILGAIVNG